MAMNAQFNDAMRPGGKSRKAVAAARGVFVRKGAESCPEGRSYSVLDIVGCQGRCLPNLTELVSLAPRRHGKTADIKETVKIRTTIVNTSNSTPQEGREGEQ